MAGSSPNSQPTRKSTAPKVINGKKPPAGYAFKDARPAAARPLPQAQALTPVQDGAIDLYKNISNAYALMHGQEHSLVDVDYSPTTLFTAYCNYPMASKIVNILPYDAFRNWRQHKSEDEAEVEAIKAVEAKINLRETVMQAAIHARLYGGAGIMIHDGRNDFSSPIVADRVRLDGIKSLDFIPLSQMKVKKFGDTFGTDTFRQPLEYNLLGKDGGTPVHPSRMVVFKGERRPSPNYTDDERSFFGESILKSRFKHIEELQEVYDTIRYLMGGAKIRILSVEDLMFNLAQVDGYEADIQNTVRMMLQQEQITKIALIDSTMKYEQHKYEFTNLPELAQAFESKLSAVTDIPATRLFGKSPDGQNATGESDLKNWNAVVRAYQTLNIQPALNNLDLMIARSAGITKGGLTPEWNQLYDSTPEERANTATAFIKVISQALLDETITRDVAKKATENILSLLEAE